MSFPDLPKKVSSPELERAAAALDGCIGKLANGFPDLRVADGANLEVGRVVRELLGTRFVFRRAQQDDLLLSLTKLAAIASANDAALELISAGYLPEAETLWQMIEQACEDLVLLSGSESPSDDRGLVIDGSDAGPAPTTGGGTPGLAEAVRRQAQYHRAALRSRSLDNADDISSPHLSIAVRIHTSHAAA